MKSIFRVPVDNQHFKDTIENGKPFDEISKFLSPEDKAKIAKFQKENLIRYWGSIPGENNKRNYEKLAENDELLCYRSGKYIALAKIALKTINRTLAKYSWGETETGNTWELIYFFHDVQLFEIEASVLNSEFGFKDGPVMGFSSLSEERVKEFVLKHGSVDAFIKQLGYEEKLQKKVQEKLSETTIHSPYEAQFYLIELGNDLKFETYVPATDAGRSAFGKKLGELTTVNMETLPEYVAPAVLRPLSNIDVIWFKEGYRPKFFYEVIHKTGISEALLRLDVVSRYYEGAKVNVIGPESGKKDFEHALRLWSGPRESLKYKDYNKLLSVYGETKYYNKIIDEFLH